MVESRHPFWNWSLEAYGRPGVEEILLDLQDRLGLDVNILLFACWAGATGAKPLTEKECRLLMAATHDWRSNVIEPLRAVRRSLKAQDRMTGAEEIRNRAKALELEAEHAAQLAIAGLLDERGELAGKDPDQARDPAQAALCGLRACLAAADIVPAGKNRALIESLAGICCG